MSIEASKYALITGPPGIGKTTLIKKVCDGLRKQQVNVYGFYTEELRNESNKRLGFDIVTLDGKRERLSRIMDALKPDDPKKFKIGEYYVFPSNFEKLVMPLFDNSKNGVLILDEIGKMELLSKTFQTKVQEAFKRTDISIVATVPVLKGASIPLVESLITNKSNKLFTVDKDNRAKLDDEIMLYLNQLPCALGY